MNWKMEFFGQCLNQVHCQIQYPIDPDKCTDQDISGLMRKVSGQRNCVNDLTKTYNAFQEKTVVHKLADTLIDGIDLEMENVRNGITDLIKAVEKEDKERNNRALVLSAYTGQK